MVKKKYFAFISYSHKDSEMAKWLQHEFENYHLPPTLNRRKDLPKSFKPVFRDEDELAGGELKPQISEALADSEYLIVVCSPNSAKSVYVDREIREFISLSPRYRRKIFPFIVEGKPHQDEKHKEQECFPLILLELSNDKTDPIELIAGDIKVTGRGHAFVKILAGILKEKGIRFTDLWDRYSHEKEKKEQKEREDKDRLLVIHSHFIVEIAKKLIEEGDSYRARLLLLKMLDREPPYVPEIDRELRKASEFDTFKIYTDGQITEHDIEISPDKSLIAFISHTTIKIIDVQDGQIINKLEGHTDTVLSIAFSPDGQYIASGSLDNTIRLWDIKKFKQVSCFTGHTDAVLSIAFSPDGQHIASGSLDNTIRLWDIKKFKHIGTLYEDHIGSVSFVSFNPDGQYVVSISLDKTLRIWNFTTRKRIQRKKIKGAGCISAISFSHDNRHFVFGYTTGFRVYKIYKWTLSNRSLFFNHYHFFPSLIISTDFVGNDVSFTPDNNYIISSSFDGSVMLWDAVSGSFLQELKPNNTLSVFLPNGKLFAKPESLLNENIVSFWTIHAQRRLLIRDNEVLYGVLSYNPSCNIIACGTLPKIGMIYVWDTKTGNILHQLVCPSAFIVTNIVICANGDYMISEHSNKTIYLWHLQSDSIVAAFEYAHFVSFSPDGEKLILNDGKSLSVHNTRSGKIVDDFSIPMISLNNEYNEFWIPTITTSILSPDGSRIYLISSEGRLYIWHLKTRVIQISGDTIQPANNISISPNGDRLISTHDNGSVGIWDAYEGQLLDIYNNDSDSFSNEFDTFDQNVGNSSANYVSYSPDGKRFLSMHDNKIVRIWDIHTKEIIVSMKVEEGTIPQFSPDGKYVICCRNNLNVALLYEQKSITFEQLRLSSSYTSGYESLSVWDTQIGECVQTIESAHSTYCYDNNKIITILNIHGFATMRIQEFLPFQDLIKKTRERFKKRQLTEEELRRLYLE